MTHWSQSSDATEQSNRLKSQLATEQHQLASDIQKAHQQWPGGAGEAIGQSLQAASELAELANQSEANDWKEASQSAVGARDKLRESQQQRPCKSCCSRQTMGHSKLLDLKTRITQLLEQQTPLVTSLQATAAAEAAGNAPPGSIDKALREAAETQERIRKQLVSGQSETDPADAFTWLLETCGQEMARSVAALERGRLMPDGLDAATSALDRLSAASEALTASTRRDEEKPNDPNDKRTEASKDPSAERDTKDQAGSLPSLASLRLLRSMQSKINLRTNELISGGVKPGDARLERLADQQNDLAQQTEKLLLQLKRAQ